MTNGASSEYVYMVTIYNVSWASRLAPGARPTWPSTPGWAQSPSHSCPVVAYLSVLWGGQPYVVHSNLSPELVLEHLRGLGTYHVCREQIPTSHGPRKKNCSIMHVNSIL